MINSIFGLIFVLLNQCCLLGFSIGFSIGFLYFLRFAKNPVNLNKNIGGSVTFFWHDNINLFLREPRNVENRKSNLFLLALKMNLFLFYIYKQKSFVFCFCKSVCNLCWCFYVHYFSVFSASVCASFFIFS
jgi:hypothetical protein